MNDENKVVITKAIMNLNKREMTALKTMLFCILLFTLLMLASVGYLIYNIMTTNQLEYSIISAVLAIMSYKICSGFIGVFVPNAK